MSKKNKERAEQKKKNLQSSEQSKKDRNQDRLNDYQTPAKDENVQKARQSAAAKYKGTLAHGFGDSSSRVSGKGKGIIASINQEATIGSKSDPIREKTYYPRNDQRKASSAPEKPSSTIGASLRKAAEIAGRQASRDDFIREFLLYCGNKPDLADHRNKYVTWANHSADQWEKSRPTVIPTLANSGTANIP